MLKRNECYGDEKKMDTENRVGFEREKSVCAVMRKSSKYAKGMGKKESRGVTMVRRREKNELHKLIIYIPLDGLVFPTVLSLPYGFVCAVRASRVNAGLSERAKKTSHRPRLALSNKRV